MFWIHFKHKHAIHKLIVICVIINDFTHFKVDTPVGGCTGCSFTHGLHWPSPSVRKRAQAWCRMLRSVRSVPLWRSWVCLPSINEADAGCMWTHMLKKSTLCMWSPSNGAGSCRPIADKDTDSLITSRSDEHCSSYGLSKFDGWHLITASPTGNFV